MNLKKCHIFFNLLAISTSYFTPIGNAAANEQRGWAVGFSPSYAYLVRKDRLEPKGMGANLFIHYGLMEPLDIRFSALWTGHWLNQNQNISGMFIQVIDITLGLRWMFDLLDFHPAIEVGMGVMHLRSEEESSIHPSGQAGIAVDYCLFSWLSLGVAFHYHLHLRNPGEYPVFFDAGPRLTFR